MPTWQVNYIAAYWVEADTEDEAIDKAIELHADLPDGSWEAAIDPWADK